MDKSLGCAPVRVRLHDEFVIECNIAKMQSIRRKSMVREQLEEARALIKAKRYDEARAILQALDHPTAAKWLDKLDEIDPPFEAESKKSRRQKKAPREKRERRGPGCLGIGLGIGCVAPAAFCVGLIVIIAIIAAVIQSQQEKEEQDALAANEGRGTLEEPVPVGQWIKFDDGEVRVGRVVRPANAMVANFNMFNDDPAAGAEYVLVWFDVLCEQQDCHLFWDVSFDLVGSDGKTWDEASAVLEPDLDSQDAIEGATVGGWQAFEVPVGATISAVRVDFESVALYAELPASETEN